VRLTILILIAFHLLACSTSQSLDYGPVTHFSDSLDMAAVAPQKTGSNLPEGWYRKAVFMEIYVRGYRDSDANGRGDFNGITEKLDYLKELGIKGIWLMPMMHSQDDDHGYAVKNYRATEPVYGSLDEFKRLLYEAHQRGIGIIFDYVINHSAALNPLFKDSKHPQSNKRDWYIWSETNKIWPRWDQQNTWHKAKSGYYYGIFWNQMPDFNMRNEEVLKFHENNLRFWLELGVDGFRFDAVGHLLENGNGLLTSQPGNDKILQRLMKVINEYDNRYMVCEDPNASLQVGSKDSCGSAFYFGMHKALLRSARLGRPAADLPGLIKRAPHGEMALMLANHDAFAGDRIIRQLAGNLDSYKMAASLLLTLPGIPFIYYGEEIGMGHTRQGVGDHALRSPMSWNSNPENAGFTEAKRFFRNLADNSAEFNVEKQLRNSDSLLNYYRSLIHLRNNTPALQSGDFQNVTQAASSVFSFVRDNGQQQAFILINLGEDTAEADFSDKTGGWTLSYSTSSGNAVELGKIRLAPHSMLVFTK
jgi:alpha-amylase